MFTPLSESQSSQQSLLIGKNGPPEAKMHISHKAPPTQNKRPQADESTEHDIPHEKKIKLSPIVALPPMKSKVPTVQIATQRERHPKGNEEHVKPKLTFPIELNLPIAQIASK